MIYEEERSTDELVDEILGAGDGEKKEEAEDAPDGSRWDIPGEGTERATCRRCGAVFLKPPKSKRTLCPACFAAQVSAGMKASHAARRAKREARKAEAERRKETMEQDEKTVAEAWEQLGAPETEASKAPEREPEDMTKDELRERLAGGMKKDAGDVVLALYECIRDVARTAGVQTRTVLEGMWEVDNILSHIGGV